MQHSYTQSLTVVIPVLNEEMAIETVIENIKTEGYEHILVVDGYSTDKTVQIAEKMGVHVIYQAGEGKTGAIETAIMTIETPYMVFLDGDCTYDPKDIINIANQFDEADLVIGVRANGRENIPLFNRFGNWFINFEFNTLVGASLVDVCSGMYGLRTEFAKTLIFETSGFDVEVEIAAQAVKYGVVAQVPINYYDRVGQQKLQPVKHGLKIIFTVLKMGMRNIIYGSLLRTVPPEFEKRLVFSGSNQRTHARAHSD